MPKTTSSQQASDIYRAANARIRAYDTSPEPAASEDLLIVEHILRALLEVLTPEQRLQILEKVK